MTFARDGAAIRCRDELLRQTIAQLLHQTGVEILQIEAEAQSLEEMFLTAIGAESRP